MKTLAKLVLTTGISFCGLGSIPSAALAMPLSGLSMALATPADDAAAVENVRWICGPYGGCRWVPGWRRHEWWGPRYGWGPGYWGPRRWGYDGLGGPWGHRYYW